MERYTNYKEVKRPQQLIVLAKCQDCDWFYSTPVNREDLNEKMEYMTGVATAHQNFTEHTVNIDIFRHARKK